MKNVQTVFEAWDGRKDRAEFHYPSCSSPQAGAHIYGLPYFRYDYYDAYLEVYHLTNTQMGVFGSIFGVFGMISYLFGGYLADRVSIRLLLTVSLVGTGLGGFLHLLPLTFPMLVGLYAFWGSPPCLRSGPPV